MCGEFDIFSSALYPFLIFLLLERIVNKLSKRSFLVAVALHAFMSKSTFTFLLLLLQILLLLLLLQISAVANFAVAVAVAV